MIPLALIAVMFSKAAASMTVAVLEGRPGADVIELQQRREQEEDTAGS